MDIKDKKILIASFAIALLVVLYAEEKRNINFQNSIRRKPTRIIIVNRTKFLIAVSITVLFVFSMVSILTYYWFF